MEGVGGVHPPWDEAFFFIYRYSLLNFFTSPSVTSFLRGAPPPKKNPGSAPDMVEWTTLLHAKDNINGSWIPSSTEQSLCKPLLFSKSTQIRYLLLWMHQGLSPPWFIMSRGISATLNMKSRLTIKFPKCPTPGKTKFIKFPPSRAGKDVKCPGGGDV